MATFGDRTSPPEQNRGGKDNHKSGTREPLIPLSELRATVSQLLKEAGNPRMQGAGARWLQLCSAG